MISRPDVLVLGGGGVLGEAWMTGVLAGIEDATGFDLRECEYFVGTSAGSIVAANLAAGNSPRRPRRKRHEREPEPELEHPPETALATAARQALSVAGDVAFAAGAPIAQLILTGSRHGGALARAALLRRMPRPSGSLRDLHRRVEASGARFDGRLRIVALDRSNGQRVVFGAPGAPRASVADAVTASCTVPWLFAPVKIGGREYVDGGVWSASNLDVAPAGRDTQVLCLNPTAAMTVTNTLVGVARGLSRSAVSLEALALRRRGAIVEMFGPNVPAALAMGADFMDPRPRERVLAAGYQQGLQLA